MYDVLNKLKIYVQQDIKNGNHPKAILNIDRYSSAAYGFNQFYTDEMIESAVFAVEHGLAIPGHSLKINDKNVLFYDGFWNVDTRGLALIYLEALFDLGFNVYYVTNIAAKGQKPVTEGLIRKRNGKIIYIKENLNDNVSVFKAICKAFEYVEPRHAFLYIYPNDVPAVMAFNRVADSDIIRYQINLTDHAFWLGVNAFDYCLEFRDYGACISHYKRGIPVNKLLFQPYYPRVDNYTPFTGYPFEKCAGDFVIFSGGSVYKTLSKDKAYYNLVGAILRAHKNVKFWYAGDKLCDDMKKLMESYPGRCFFTGERQDLVELLKHVDMYLSTYPLVGGLMFQYAAVAGKSPYTLYQDDCAWGFLLNEERLGVHYDDSNKMLKDIDRYIRDEQYRKTKDSMMKNAVISKNNFTENLYRIMMHGKSAFTFKLREIDDSKFKQIYADRTQPA